MRRTHLGFLPFVGLVALLGLALELGHKSARENPQSDHIWEVPVQKK